MEDSRFFRTVPITDSNFFRKPIKGLGANMFRKSPLSDKPRLNMKQDQYVRPMAR